MRWLVLIAVTLALRAHAIEPYQTAQQLYNTPPVAAFTNNGSLNIRTATGKTIKVPLSVATVVNSNQWQTTYQTDQATLMITHAVGSPNYYTLNKENVAASTEPFAGSDFSIADLGLEFLHWSTQRILPKTTNLKRGREYTLLESSNPEATGYSLVLSWIGSKILSNFPLRSKALASMIPPDSLSKSFKKVNGHWELQEMEISNVQAGTRTRLEFNL